MRARNRAAAANVGARIAIADVARSASIARIAATNAESIEEAFDVATRFVEDRTEFLAAHGFARIAAGDVAGIAIIVAAELAARIAIARSTRIARIATAIPFEELAKAEGPVAADAVAGAAIASAGIAGIAIAAEFATRITIACSARVARIAGIVTGEKAAERTEGTFSTRIATDFAARITGDDTVAGTAFHLCTGLAHEQFFQT